MALGRTGGATPLEDLPANQKINIGGDTNLYRSAAGTLATDGVLNAVGGLQLNGAPVATRSYVDSADASLRAYVDSSDASVRSYADSGDSAVRAYADALVSPYSWHIAQNSGVHGVVGNVVGTTDTQTLTNKTISGTNNTLSGIADASITALSASKLIGTVAIGQGGTGSTTAPAARTALGNVPSVITATMTVDFPPINEGRVGDIDVTVNGAQINDAVAVSMPPTWTNFLVQAFVSGPNTVTLRALLCNTGPVDPLPGTFTIKVFQA